MMFRSLTPTAPNISNHRNKPTFPPRLNFQHLQCVWWNMHVKDRQGVAEKKCNTMLCIYPACVWHRIREKDCLSLMDREISLSSASGQQSPCSLISGIQLSSAQQRTSKTVFGSSRVSSLLFRWIICAILKHRWISKQIVLKQDRSVLKPSKSTMHLHKRAV